MRIKVFRINGRENAIGLKIFPGSYFTKNHEEEVVLDVLVDAISKGKCAINLSENILAVDFLYDGTGGSLKFHINDSDNDYMEMEKILKYPFLIEIKRRYNLPLSENKLEGSAMIIYLKRVDYSALFKWLFETQGS